MLSSTHSGLAMGIFSTPVTNNANGRGVLVCVCPSLLPAAYLISAWRSLETVLAAACHSNANRLCCGCLCAGLSLGHTGESAAVCD